MAIKVEEFKTTWEKGSRGPFKKSLLDYHKTFLVLSLRHGLNSKIKIFDFRILWSYY